MVENGSHWSGTIGSNNYQYGSTVYFWIEARDNANNLQWLNSSFQVIDIYPPTLTLVTTAPYTTLDNASVQKDFLVTVNAADNASGVQEVQLIFSINSYPGWNNVSMIYIANPLGNNLYQFTIPKDNLSAGTFNYIIKAIDNSNISQQISGNGIIQSAGSSTTQTQPNRGLGSNSIILLIIIIAVVAAVSVSVIMIRRYRIKAGSDSKARVI